MQEFDIAIVGGGPAGSSCAWALRNSGLTVIVLDRAVFPRDKVCAGWITPPVFELLEIDPASYGNGRTLQSITGFKTGVLGEKLLTTNYGRTVSYGIRRFEFDHYLLNRCGAKLNTSYSVNNFQRVSGRWVINSEISAQVLVGAGGNFCPVARILKTDANGDLQVTAQEVEFELTDEQLNRSQIIGTVPELFFCPDLNGYGWCFRKGNFLNVGLGHLYSTHLKSDLPQLIDFLSTNGLTGISIPARMRGHAYRLARRRNTVCAEGVLLIGDSAGLASPASGEGIRPAIESGLRAAEIILEHFPDVSSGRLAEYEHWINDRFTGPSQWPRSLNSVATCLGKCTLSSRLLSRYLILDRCFLQTHLPQFQIHSATDSIAT